LSLMDALFYWLQMKLVSEARPDDGAAVETISFFAQILSEDHGLASFEVSSMDEAKIYVAYKLKDGDGRTVWFDREAAEQMLTAPVFTKDETVRNEDNEEENA
jgi:hypothetical protein